MSIKSLEYVDKIFNFNTFAAAALDPRVKLELMPSEYNNLRHLRQVMDNGYPPQMPIIQEGTSSSSNQSTNNLLESLARQRRATAESQGVFDEIHSYLAEAVVDTSADALLWWKYNEKEFPTTCAYGPGLPGHISNIRAL
ncbi:hypothetical protein PsorP6_018593 [Peronosclerospora sorghi]|nr:hypothetical protein PsorP6_018596 [Peronosclerospora sorghi]KAI9895251.1 hypothetical protein PsorP6_018593 [Peronosclerospora sorghi]